MNDLCRFSDTCQQTLVILSRRFRYPETRTDRAPGGLYPTPSNTNPVPSATNRSGITSISRARSVCWTSYRVPATTLKESLMLKASGILFVLNSM